MELHPIGVIRSPFTELAGMPIQPTGAVGVKGTVELLPEYAEGLADLDGFSHVVLVYLFDRSAGYELKVVPFLDTVPRGLFATRAPRRPNPIGLSTVVLERVAGRVLHVEGLDVLDGTPLLDVKPYVPEVDAPAPSRVGWLEAARDRVRDLRSDARFAPGPRLVVRDETPADAGAITEVTVAAFATLAISEKTEHLIVEALRAAGALTVSLVAELDGRVVGHVAFSPVAVSDGTPGWYGLGPVSVRPEHQRRGIGAALIREGLQRLEARGARGCCLVGHPGYYGRFGFENVRGLGHEGVPPEAFFARAFAGPVPTGRVAFHDAFRTGRSAPGGAG